MSVYLIRHGETDSNAQRIVQLPETPLSDRGREQAHRLAQRLADSGITRVLSSDFERAAMTAAPLVEATGAELEFDADLQERDFGELRGRPYAEFDFDPFAADYAPPGGESWEVFHDRVDRAWRRITEETAATRGQLAVVTHGLVLRAVLERHLQVAHAPAADTKQRFLNTSLTQVDDLAPGWRVRLLACTDHLEGIDPA